ncbi:hypothetical protein ACFW93_40645 [Streptomyces canus]|uniref:hypothetical protein n=1 Tax=Streptomyces canus TaxID=58343 RepID=UPI0036B061CA
MERIRLARHRILATAVARSGPDKLDGIAWTASDDLPPPAEPGLPGAPPSSTTT